MKLVFAQLFLTFVGGLMVIPSAESLCQMKLALTSSTISYQNLDNQQAAAQRSKSADSFQGNWTWMYFLKERDLRDPEKVEIYKQLAGEDDIKATPFMLLTLKLTRKGNTLTGECDSGMRFGTKIDEGSFTSIIKGNTTEFELISSFGGKVTVRLMSRRNRLYWQIINIDNSEGDYWYPENAILHREPTNKPPAKKK
jgi:hypothetical protein